MRQVNSKSTSQQRKKTNEIKVCLFLSVYLRSYFIFESIVESLTPTLQSSSRDVQTCQSYRKDELLFDELTPFYLRMLLEEGILQATGGILQEEPVGSPVSQRALMLFQFIVLF